MNRQRWNHVGTLTPSNILKLHKWRRNELPILEVIGECLIPLVHPSRERLCRCQHLGPALGGIFRRPKLRDKLNKSTSLAHQKVDSEWKRCAEERKRLPIDDSVWKDLCKRRWCVFQESLCGVLQKT